MLDCAVSQHLDEAGRSIGGEPAGRAQVGVGRFVTFLLLLAILIQRGWVRLSIPDFWAEDGRVFFLDALTDGVRSLLHPMAGSYFTIERLIMLGAVKLAPLAWVPFVVCLACIGVTAFIMSRIVADDYDWLVPSPTVRLMAACLFCLLPGLNEMLGNLCNLNWILFCWPLLAGLQDPRRPLTGVTMAAIALVAISVGTSILLVPLFVWRAVAAASPRGAARSAAREWWVVAILVIAGALVPALFGGTRPPGSPGVTMIGLARVWYDHVARLVGFTPWIGDRLTFALDEWQPTGLYRAGKVAFLAFGLIWAWRHRHEPRAQAIAIAVAGVSTWTVLSAVTRTYALDLLQRQRGPWFYEYRYSFIMSFAAVLFWVVVLDGSRRRAGRRAATPAIAFLSLGIILSAHRFNIDAYSNPRYYTRAIGPTVVVAPLTTYNVDPPRTAHWQEAAPILARALATGCPHSVTVLQYPDPWAFTYVSPRPAAACP